MNLNELEKMIEEMLPLYEKKSEAKEGALNEVLLCWYLAEESGLNQVGEIGGAQAVNDKIYSLKDEANLTDEIFDTQNERAWAMADAVIEWAQANDYGTPTNVIWTGTAGALQRAIAPLPQYPPGNKNPADVLLKFGNNSFLGVSAKSTSKKTGGIAFANPGVPEYAKKGLEVIKARELIKLARKFPKYRAELLDGTDNSRDTLIKSLQESGADPEFIHSLYFYGIRVLRVIRDRMVDYMTQTLYQRQLKLHLRRDWIRASKLNMPYYIVATGRGSEGGYSADIQDPMHSEIAKSLSRDDIIVEEVDFVEIKGKEQQTAALKFYGISPTGKQTYWFKIRVKWESRPFASSIKLLGK